MCRQPILHHMLTSPALQNTPEQRLAALTPFALLVVSGGWYDAGDNIKFGLPMASSTTLLLWGLIRYERAWEASGQLQHMRATVRWALDYFIKAHAAKDELYVQVWLRSMSLDMAS